MKDYVLEIRPPTIAKDLANSAKLEAHLHAAALRESRRLLAQLRWPVQMGMPEFLFSVSALAQPASQAREVWLEMHQAARKGQAMFPFRALQQDLELVSLDKPAKTAHLHCSCRKTAARPAGRSRTRG